MSSITPLRIGIIGYRGFGAFCTEAFHEFGLGRVVAFAGRDLETMQETARRYGVPHTYANWRELVADPEVELVHIVTPPDMHAEMAIAALQAGKHVLIEKPLATSNEDAAAILAAERESEGLVAGINYVMRYNPLYQNVAQIAHSGWLGPLTHVSFQNYASDEGLMDNHWFWDKAQSGGIFVEHGVHFFDIIGSVIGAPARSVAGQTWFRGDGTHKEDRVQAIVTHENGVTATYYHAFNRPGALEKQIAHFAFERGHITLDGWIPTRLSLQAIVDDAGLSGLQTLLPIEKSGDPEFAAGREVRGNGKPLFVQHRVTANVNLGDPTHVYQNAVQDALADLHKAVREPSHCLRVSAPDGAASLRIALAAAQAAESGLVQELG